VLQCLCSEAGTGVSRAKRGLNVFTGQRATRDTSREAVINPAKHCESSEALLLYYAAQACSVRPISVRVSYILNFLTCINSMRREEKSAMNHNISLAQFLRFQSR